MNIIFSLKEYGGWRGNVSLKPVILSDGAPGISGFSDLGDWAGNTEDCQ